MDNENNNQEVNNQTEGQGAQGQNQGGAGENKNTEDKAQRTIEKLQQRLGKLTGDKNTAEQALEELKARNAELEKLVNDYKQGKTVKELSDKEKAKQEAQAKDDEIKALKAQIARNQALSDTNEVLKSQGYNVPRDVLELVVSDDSEKTLANTNALLAFIGQVADGVRANTLKGSTPTKTGAPVKTMTKQEIMAIKDDVARQKAMRENWSLFQ